MNSIIQRFLRAKHWQLFLLMFGLPLLFQFLIIGFMIGLIFKHSHPDPTFLFSYFKMFPVIMILFLGVFFGWFWSIGIGLQEKLPSELRMNTSTFKVLFFIPLVYIVFFSIAVGVLMTSVTSIIETNDPSAIGFAGVFIAIIIPLHLFSICCIFYCMYFVSKTFKTAELQRRTSFADFAGEFFLIWFYPVGVWILQPKINKLVNEETH